VRAKNVGEKIGGKSEKSVFLNSHEYRDQKMEGTKRTKQFFQKHTNSASKKCWGKNCRKKVRITCYYIHTNIVTKKLGGKKRAKQFFQKNKNSAIKKCWEKNRRKKVRKTFLYIHTNIVTKKWGGKTSETIFPETQ